MFKMLATAVALSLAALGSVSAATVSLTNGQIVNPIVASDDYIFEDVLNGVGGPGSVSFTFVADAADAPLPVLATTANLGGDFVNPYLSWFDGTTTVFATFTDLGFAKLAELSTLFTDPDALTQTLTLGWDSYRGPVQVSIQVSTVPLPAGGLLLIGAIGGLAVLRRRKALAA